MHAQYISTELSLTLADKLLSMGHPRRSIFRTSDDHKKGRDRTIPSQVSASSRLNTYLYSLSKATIDKDHHFVEHYQYKGNLIYSRSLRRNLMVYVFY
jgi:hypothetical protein